MTNEELFVVLVDWLNSWGGDPPEPPKTDLKEFQTEDRDAILWAAHALSSLTREREEYLAAGLEASDKAIKFQATILKLEKDLADARGQVCRAREAATLAANHLHASPATKEKVFAQVKEALSSSSPCAHAENAKELEAELDATIVTGRKREERIVVLEKERDRLREAVEWACKYGDFPHQHAGKNPVHSFKRELRRRAEGGK